MTESFIDSVMAHKGGRAIVFGHGGGGSALEAPAIVNLLRRLEYSEIWVGGVASSWWGDSGAPVTGTATSIVLGPTVYSVKELTQAEIVDDNIAVTNSDTRYHGYRPAEAIVADILGVPTFIIGMKNGVVGAADSLRSFVRAHDIDLVVSIDVGSDTFFRGKEENPAHTPLIDFMAIGVLLAQTCDVEFGLIGWGLDGELLPEDLEANVGLVMQAGGFRGAYGITLEDARQLEEGCVAFHDPVEIWVARAARGELGWRRMPISSPFGQPIRVTPLAPVILFFDLVKMVEVACTAAREVASSQSLEEAEEIFARHTGAIPETRFKKTVTFVAD